MRVLVACEYSGAVRDAFTVRGHFAMSCDLLESETTLSPAERHRVHRMPPGPDRWRERSRTFPGIAGAMAEQWGQLDTPAPDLLPPLPLPEPAGLW